MKDALFLILPVSPVNKERRHKILLQTRSCRMLGLLILRQLRQCCHSRERAESLSNAPLQCGCDIFSRLQSATCGSPTCQARSASILRVPDWTEELSDS